jgi:outer membrane protein
MIGTILLAKRESGRISPANFGWMLILFGMATVLPAQPDTSLRRSITLNESLERAVANSGQVRKLRIDESGLAARAREARSAALPQVRADLHLDYVPVLPTQILSGNVAGLSDEDYIPVQFGRPWQLGAGVMVEQQLYNRALLRLRAAGEAGRDLSSLAAQRSEDEVMFQTATVYYQALQTQQLLRTIDANIAKLKELERITALSVSNDYAIPLDVKRLRVARTNLETQRRNLLDAVDGLQQTLQLLTGSSVDTILVPVATDTLAPGADSLQWRMLQPEEPIEDRLLQRQIELNRVQAHSLLGEAWPTVQAYAQARYDTFRDDPNFFDGGTRWYAQAAVGFKVEVPVFDGFRRQAKYALMEVERLKLEEDRRQLGPARALEFRQAKLQVEGALRLLNYQAENIAVAREVVEKTTLTYREGITPLTDLLNAQTALAEAETNYWQQVYAYRLAVLKLLKAAGKLDMLRGDD